MVSDFFFPQSGMLSPEFQSLDTFIAANGAQGELRVISTNCRL